MNDRSNIRKALPIFALCVEAYTLTFDIYINCSTASLPPPCKEASYSSATKEAVFSIVETIFILLIREELLKSVLLAKLHRQRQPSRFSESEISRDHVSIGHWTNIIQ
jgi:hypothetical protein